MARREAAVVAAVRQHRVQLVAVRRVLAGDVGDPRGQPRAQLAEADSAGGRSAWWAVFAFTVQAVARGDTLVIRLGSERRTFVRV